MKTDIVIVSPALLVRVASMALILTGAPLNLAHRYPLARLAGFAMCFAGWTIGAAFWLTSHDWLLVPVAVLMAVWDLYLIWKIRPEVR